MANESGTAGSVSTNDTTAFMSFIADVKDGKFTAQKPDLIQITYKRFDIDEYQSQLPSGENIPNIPLFGLTY